MHSQAFAQCASTMLYLTGWQRIPLGLRHAIDVIGWHLEDLCRRKQLSKQSKYLGKIKSLHRNRPKKPLSSHKYVTSKVHSLESIVMTAPKKITFTSC